MTPLTRICGMAYHHNAAEAARRRAKQRSDIMHAASAHLNMCAEISLAPRAYRHAPRAWRVPHMANVKASSSGGAVSFKMAPLIVRISVTSWQRWRQQQQRRLAARMASYQWRSAPSICRLWHQAAAL